MPCPARDSANFDNSYKIDNCSNTFFIDINRTCIPHYKPILLENIIQETSVVWHIPNVYV